MKNLFCFFTKKLGNDASQKFLLVWRQRHIIVQNVASRLRQLETKIFFAFLPLTFFGLHASLHFLVKFLYRHA